MKDHNVFRYNLCKYNMAVTTVLVLSISAVTAVFRFVSFAVASVNRKISESAGASAKANCSKLS